MSSDVQFPRNWVSVETGKAYERIQLVPNSPEYMTVVKNVLDQGGDEYADRIYMVYFKRIVLFAV